MSLLSKLLKVVLGGDSDSSGDKPVSEKPRRNEAPASGDSWGEFMPDEPNQFNYPGDYRAYFSDIFRTEFSDYTVDVEECEHRPATIFTLYRNGQRALVVELVSENSSSHKVEKNCAMMGVPYRRFYYNHDGWWNARSYVIRRCRAALNGERS